MDALSKEVRENAARLIDPTYQHPTICRAAFLCKELWTNHVAPY
jgi:hypothetical protein